MSNPLNTINARVARVIAGRRLTQAQVAHDLGVSRSYINAVVHGRTPPSTALLDYLITRHQVDEAWLRGVEVQPAGELHARLVEVASLVDALRDAVTGLVERPRADGDLHDLLDAAVTAAPGNEHRIRGYLEYLASPGATRRPLEGSAAEVPED